MDFLALQVPNHVYPLFHQALSILQQTIQRHVNQENLYHPNSVHFGENGNLPKSCYTHPR